MPDYPPSPNEPVYVPTRRRTRIPPIERMYELVETKAGLKWKPNPAYIRQRLDGLQQPLLDDAVEQFWDRMEQYRQEYGAVRVRIFYYGSISDGQNEDYWSTTWYLGKTRSGFQKTRAALQEIIDAADYPLALYGLGRPI